MKLFPFLLNFFLIKGDIIMKKERKFTWCVRIYNVMSGTVDYRIFANFTVREINERVKDFIDFNNDCVVRIFKQYKKL